MFFKKHFLLIMTAWCFSSEWANSPDPEGAVLLQHPLAFLPGPHCAWILPGAHHGHWCSRWILAILTKSHCSHSGRAELTQMLPCSDLAQMPEACDTCLEYFTGCALWTWWEVCTPLLWNFITFSVLSRQTCSTINLQTDMTTLLVPVFQYPETLEDWAEEPRVSLGGLRFL